MESHSTPAAERDTSLLIPNKESPFPDTPRSSPRVNFHLQVPIPNERRDSAERRFRHAEKMEKKRARCCRFFCFFGLFFGIIFLFMAPVSWWQTLVCTPSPSVWENSLLGMTANGRFQDFYITIPDIERVWYGSEMIHQSAEDIYKGVGTFEPVHGLYFWCVPGMIHVYSRDGAKMPHSIEIPGRIIAKEEMLQAITVEATIDGFVLYAIHSSGDIFTYSPSEGWSSEPISTIKTPTPASKKHEETQTAVWNFAHINTQKRVLYFAGLPTPSLYRLDLSTMALSSQPVDHHLLFNSRYDPTTDSFIWLRVEGERNLTTDDWNDDSKISVYRFHPFSSPPPTPTPSPIENTRAEAVFFDDELATSLRHENKKMAFNYNDNRFFILNTYNLRMYTFSFDHKHSSNKTIEVESYKTRLAYPVSLVFAPRKTF